MKKTVAILLGILLGTSAYAEQNLEDNYEKWKREGAEKRTYIEGIFSIIEYRKNDKICKEKYLRGEPNGLVKCREGILEKEYYRTGDLASIKNLITGKSKWFNRWENGYVMTETDYDGSEKKKLVDYHKNGQPEREENYKNGQIEGVRKWYYASGKISKEENFKHGQLNGLTRSYHENGQLKIEINYKDGQEEDGLRKQFFENGKLMNEYSVKNGRPDGVAKCYDRNGEQETEVIFEDGQAIGGYIYDRDGIIRYFYPTKRKMNRWELEHLTWIGCPPSPPGSIIE